MGLSTWTYSVKQSLAENCLNSIFRQFQLTGLFAGTSGSLRESPNKIADFNHLVFTLIELIHIQKEYFVPVDQPFIYNNSAWFSEALCGYTSETDMLTFREMFASYTDSWAAQRNCKQAARNAFLKCAIWFAENNENPVSGIKLLFDLYSHGYFLDSNLFSETLNIYVRLYSMRADFGELKGTGIADKEEINTYIGNVLQKYESTQLDVHLMDSFLGIVCELTIENFAFAKSASTLDEWLIRETSISGPVIYCSYMKWATKNWQLSVFVRRMLSNIEEIGADNFSLFAMRDLQATYHLPPDWKLSYIKDIANEYFKKCPRNSWLERLYLDRLVFPLDVLEIVKNAGLNAFKSNLLPDYWQFPSLKLAFPICSAHDRFPYLCRRIDFRNKVIYQKAKDMGVETDGDEGIKEARLKLLELESQMLEKRALELRGDHPSELIELEKFISLYPWNSTPRRLSVLLTSKYTNLVDIESLINCILLEPNSLPNWLALMGYSKKKKLVNEEQLFANIIAYLQHQIRAAHD
jgi:hypothetical protein